MSGRNRYMVLHNKYVVIATKSHIRGEWKSGQILRSLGIGNIQYVSQTRPICMKTLKPACTRPKVVINSAARVNGRRDSTFRTRRMAEMNVPAWLIPIQNTVLAKKIPQKTGLLTP